MGEGGLHEAQAHNTLITWYVDDRGETNMNEELKFQWAIRDKDYIKD